MNNNAETFSFLSVLLSFGPVDGNIRKKKQLRVPLKSTEEEEGHVLSRDYPRLGEGRGANMADEAEEVNTVAEDGEAGEKENKTEASTDEAKGDFKCHDVPDNVSATAAAENSWSAPLLSLARKATETISSGVNYAASQRNPSQGSSVSSPARNEPENDVGNSSQRLPGQFDVVFLSDSSVFTRIAENAYSQKLCHYPLFLVSCHST